MFTVAQCLAKAVELDLRAGESCPPEARAQFATMALEWRHLAARALIQDERAASAGTPRA